MPVDLLVQRIKDDTYECPISGCEGIFIKRKDSTWFGSCEHDYYSQPPASEEFVGWLDGASWEREQLVKLLEGGA